MNRLVRQSIAEDEAEAGYVARDGVVTKKPMPKKETTREGLLASRPTGLLVPSIASSYWWIIKLKTRCAPDQSYRDSLMWASRQQWVSRRGDQAAIQTNVEVPSVREGRRPGQWRLPRTGRRVERGLRIRIAIFSPGSSSVWPGKWSEGFDFPSMPGWLAKYPCFIGTHSVHICL